MPDTLQPRHNRPTDRLLALCVMLWALMLCGLGPTASLAGDPPAAEPKPEEEHEENTPLLKREPSRLLELPKYILELPWYPIKHFLNFSERTDLINRTMDLFYFNEERTAGWFPNYASSGSGVEGVGISIFHHNLFEKGQEADLAFAYSADDQIVVRIAYTIHPRQENPNFFKMSSTYVRDDDVQLYAREVCTSTILIFPCPPPSLRLIPGSDTKENDLASYFLRRVEAMVTVGKRVLQHLDLSVHLRGFQAQTSAGRPRPAPLPISLAGLGEDIGMVGGGGRLIWDGRDNPLRPFVGALVKAGGEALASPRTTSDGTRFAYTRYWLDVQYFLPIYEPRRVIVFRHTLERVDPIGGRAIPFYELPILDFEHHLRSFDRNRFQDRGALSFSLEYHYPIWVTWDAFLFIDAGQVFEQYADIAANDFQFSEGAAIRFMTKDKLLFVFQFGVGREGTKFLLSLQQIF